MSILGYISPGWVATNAGPSLQPAAGNLYYTAVDRLRSDPGFYWAITGIAFNVGGAAATAEQVIVALYDVNGALIANSALAGTNVTAAASTWQEVPFTAQFNPGESGRYFAAVTFTNVTTLFIRTYDATGTGGSSVRVLTGTQAGYTFGQALPSITPPTSMGPLADGEAGGVMSGFRRVGWA